MCALFGSPDIKTFIELAELNSYRGNHSYSVAITDFERVRLIVKSLGEFQMPDISNADFYIGHTQAPTTEAKSITSVHPSEINGTFLWHNGIIKDHQVKKWQEKLNSSEPWDTKLLHQLLSQSNATEILSEADGSFACVWYNGEGIYLFRNANCPLFTDGISYSSTQFENSEAIEENTFYLLNWKKIEKTDTMFKTNNTFYWSFE